MSNQDNQQKLLERTYTPQSPIRDVRQLMQVMWRDLMSSRDLAWRLMVRDISGKYRQSVLGFFWAFVPPVLLAGGLLLARKANVINITETELPYAAYVMLSLVLWQTFTESVNAPINAVRGAKSILTKINFPRESIILAKLGEVLFNVLIKAVFVVLVLIWFGIHPGPEVLFVPFTLFSLIAFGFFLGLVLAPIAGLFLDISKGLTIVLGLWLFVTPIIYPVPREGIFSILVNLNPVTHLVVMTRDLVTGSSTSSLVGFLVSAVIAWTGLFIAWIVFRVSMPIVTERLSA